MAWLRISKAELPPRKLAALQAVCGADPRAILDSDNATLSNCGLSRSQLQRLRECASTDPSRDLDTLTRLGIEIVESSDSLYPPRLRTIPDPPPILFARGRLEADDQYSIAIVGSRRASNYGLSIAERFARELCGYGLCIVSGGARGVDSHAHRGAMRGNGRTVAVVGCGLDLAYPAENRTLYDEIVSSGRGAVVSEYPIGAQPDPWRFPTRNRLISGLSLATVVVESPISSGAIITASIAAEQGRDVFAIPGSIENGRSSGCHRLIQEGAKLVERAEDIVDELGILRLTAETQSEPRLMAAPTIAIEPDRKAVLETLSLDARHVDQIAAACGQPVAAVTGILTLLEMRGLARRVPGNAFVRVL
jgi:DNA processing protein